MRNRLASEIKFIADSIGATVSALQAGYEPRADSIGSR